MTDRRRTRGARATARPAPLQPPTSAPSSAVVAALVHDVPRGRSLVTLVWTDDAEKKVTLPVPFGCSLAEVESAATTAVRQLATELSTLRITPANGAKG